MKLEYVSGVQIVREILLQQKRRAKALFIHREIKTSDVQEILSLAKSSKIPCQSVDRHQLFEMCQTVQHQGVVLQVEEFVYSEFDKTLEQIVSNSSENIVLLLDQIQDPHNFGAILRSASCVGVSCVVIPEHESVGVTPIVQKVSTGACEQIPICRVKNLSRAIEILKEKGFWIYGAEASEKNTLWNTKMEGQVALVLGSEGRGIRPLVKKNCDVLVSIPMEGGLSSLNVSVAAGVFLFEILRQRRVIKK